MSDEKRPKRIKEQWKQITRFPSYQVSTRGRVRRKHGRSYLILKPVYRGGYIQHSFCEAGTHITDYAHRVAFETWKGPIEDGYQVDHINGLRGDNRVENLQLLTPKENYRKERTLKHTALTTNLKHIYKTNPDINEICRYIENFYKNYRYYCPRI